MLKYAKIIDEQTKLCQIGSGSNINFYKSIGMVELDVEQSEVNENWYLVGYVPKYTEEEKREQEQERELVRARQERAAAVQNIEVEVDGMIFDGNEDAQRRISIALQTGDITGQQSVQWVLKNNTVATVTRQQLEQVLALSMQKMQELWVKPYTEEKEVNE